MDSCCGSVGRAIAFEICGSNPVIGKILSTNCKIEKTKIKKKRQGIAHLKKVVSLLYLMLLLRLGKKRLQVLTTLVPGLEALFKVAWISFLRSDINFEASFNLEKLETCLSKIFFFQTWPKTVSVADLASGVKLPSTSFIKFSKNFIPDFFTWEEVE